jgi:OOP family OmpA-OmpF porin
VLLNDVFARVAPDVTVTRDIVYLDDGSPAAWVLEYSATTGGRIDGRFPTTLTLQDISDALGISGVSGAPTFAVDDDHARGARENLALVVAYLPEIEQLTYTADTDGTTLDIVVSPGVDLDPVAIDLAERLPVDVVFSLSPLDALPSDGTTRRNQASGLDETFRSGFWIPTLEFSADTEGCDAQVTSVLTQAQITFLSGSARLDAASIRAINALAAVAQPCLDAGLALEIGGHTDATGSLLDNEVLSFERATSVLDALAARGVPRADIVAIGYGQARPIADNTTAEGRAANRRTTLSWSSN